MNDYNEFVTNFVKILPMTLGLEPNQVSFHKDGELEGLSGDRILLEVEIKGGRQAAQAIQVREIYEDYKRGVELSEILDRIRDSLDVGTSLLSKNPLEHMDQYEKVRHMLVVRPLNYTNHKTDLEGMVYKKVDEIALTVYFSLGESKGTYSSCKLREKTLNTWGLSKEEVFKEALKNTAKLYPPRICQWYDVEYLSAESDLGNFMNPFKPFHLSFGPGGNLMTTANKLNGACAIFLPGVAKRLGDLMGDDYLVVFTSIHEAMVHSLETASVDMMRSVLKDMNRKVVEKEEYLTSDIYYYHRKEDRLERIKG